MYAPEQWGTLQKFSNFYAETFKLSETGKRSISGAANHFSKALILRNLAIKITPNLDADEADLATNGYTHAINSKELSAVFEGAILELYSAVDCTRKVISEIYKKLQGIPSKSTRIYFKNVLEGKTDIKFPEQLVIAVKEATWYDSFRILRDELTHHDTGRCHKDSDSGAIRYMHNGILINGKCLIIDDIFEKLDSSINEVNQFIGRVFSHLLTELDDKPVRQFCGIFNSRMYSRFVSPFDTDGFHGGVCESKQWFDLPDNPTCIFAGECGAYTREKKLL
jgi:hypothetical protein